MPNRTLRLSSIVLVPACAALLACGAADETGDEFLEAPQEITISTTANYTITGLASGKCLQLAGSSTADLATAEIRTCNGGTAQSFRFETTDSGYYRVRNVRSNKCLDVRARSTADGAEVIQYTCGSGTNQQFKPVDVSSGVVRLVARHSQKVIDVAGYATADGSKVHQWSWLSGTNQQWKLSTGTGTSTDTTIPMTIPAANGTEVMSSTKALPAGVHDFGNKRVGVVNPKGCDGEGQPAVFELADGATVKNLIVHGGTPGGNGIVCKGSCTLENVYWEDVCEDAATNSKDGAVMRINRAIALHATDKVFQHNAKGGSRTIITNSYIADFGKVWRSCGDCTNNGGPRHVELHNVKVEGVRSTVIGLNENYGDTATIRNLFIKGGYDAADDDPHVCQVFKGVQKGSGSSTKLYGGASQFNTSTCNVSLSDLKSW